MDNMKAIEQNSLFITLFKLTISGLKFTTYLIISFLEYLIKILKIIFNLTDYEPFKPITDSKNTMLDRIAYKNINKEKIRFTTDFLCRHEYVFTRSDMYLSTYKMVQQRLKDVSDNNIKLNNDLYRDTIKQINILIVESEKQALSEGYGYARETQYKLDTSTVYDNFIQNKIMTGQSNRKF